MKRFIPFEEKREEELDVVDMLIHSLTYLDSAAAMAVKNDDARLLIDIYKQSMKASDRLISVVLHLEGEEKYDRPVERQPGEPGFGFELAPGECDIEADGE